MLLNGREKNAGKLLIVVQRQYLKVNQLYIKYYRKKMQNMGVLGTNLTSKDTTKIVIAKNHLPTR